MKYVSQTEKLLGPKDAETEAESVSEQDEEEKPDKKKRSSMLRKDSADLLVTQSLFRRSNSQLIPRRTVRLTDRADRRETEKSGENSDAQHVAFPRFLPCGVAAQSALPREDKGDRGTR